MLVSSTTVTWALLVFVLLGLSSETAGQRSTCMRRPPSFTDCSSTTGECNLVLDSNNLPDSLPFPPPNTRTCYRTCHDETGRCQSVPTGVREQKLGVERSTGKSRVFRIFSPNYGRGDYRKSTNCRYNVQCEPGQIISYSVLDFDLETSNTCFGKAECLDYVEIHYPNLGTRKRFCGGGEKGEIHVDGSNQLTFVFVSNRRNERPGFLFFVNCIDPGSDSNAIRTGAVAPPPRPPTSVPQPSASIIGNVVGNQCSQPADMAPRVEPFEIPPPTAAFGVPALTVRRYVVKMFGTIYYKTGCLLVRDAEGEVVHTIRGVSSLQVINRLSTNRRLFHASSGITFNGYGVLEVGLDEATFHQQGADPVFQPTPEESRTIIELERVINSFLESDYFDVQDAYDIQQDTVSFPDQQITQDTLTLLPPGLNSRNPRRTIAPRNILDRATTLATQYGNACNGVLRSTACAYQALLLGTDCDNGFALN